MLALFWESPWGRSFAHAAVFNEARGHAAYARALGDELHRVRDQLGRVLAAYHAPRAANEPLFAVDVGPVAYVDHGDGDGVVFDQHDHALISHTAAPQAGQVAFQRLAL